jgi:hypothetical protein
VALPIDIGPNFGNWFGLGQTKIPIPFEGLLNNFTLHLKGIQRGDKFDIN